MEQWELLVQQYTEQPTLRDLNKAVENAKVALGEDLAPFEIEYTLQTFLGKPVSLLQTLISHYSDETWMATTSKCFDLLTDIVDKFSDNVEDYLDDIVKTCIQPYTALHVRRRALLCLCRVCPRAPAQMSAVLAALCDAVACSEGGMAVRAARAELLGAICEHHPELLTNNKEALIWRICLSVLETAKTSVTLVNGVLVCFNGLFKHFGMYLPTSELNTFYDTMTREYIHQRMCLEACLNILTNYTQLFPERISKDVRLRAHLWALIKEDHTLNPKAVDALVAVYEVTVNWDNAREIITNELFNRTMSRHSRERNASYKITSAILKKYGRNISDICDVFDKQASSACAKIEFGLETKLATETDTDEYDHDLVNLMDEASWCIDTNVPGCENLLRAMILLHSSIPTNRKRKLLTHNILRASSGLRSAAITFIIAQSLIPPEPNLPKTENINKYFSIWTNLFDSKKETDTIVLENCKYVFDDFMRYFLTVTDAVLDEPGEITQTKQNLSNLYLFASQIITLENAREFVKSYTAAILERCFDICNNFGLIDGLVTFVAMFVSVCEDMFEDGGLRDDLVEKLKGFYENLDISRCTEESVLCATCLALTQVPAVLFDKDERILDALQVIFQRTDVEPKTLSMSIKKLDKQIQKQNGKVTPKCRNLIPYVEKLLNRNNLTGKDARVLQRDVIMFLGKHGSLSLTTHERSHSMLVVQLQNSLSLNVMNLAARSQIKLNLSRVLDSALTHEDPEALHTLLLIISANLSNRPDPVLQQTLTVVIYKLSKCHGRGERGDVESLLTAVTLCDRSEGVLEFITYISTEKSPGVRKILSNVLERLLLHETHTEGAQVALRTLIERVVILINSDIYSSKQAGLDMMETVISALKENNELTVEYMATLIKTIASVDNNYEALNITTKHFVEKIVLFPKEEIKALISELFEKISSLVYGGENLRKTIKLSMDIFKAIFECLEMENKDFVNYLTGCKYDRLNGYVKYLILVTEAKKIFNFDMGLCRKIISINDFMVMNFVWKVLDEKNESRVINISVILNFLECYCDVMLEMKYQETINLLHTTIDLKPEHVKPLQKDIKKCLESYKNVWKTIPRTVYKNFEKWCCKFQMNKIVDNLRRKMIKNSDEIIIKALKIMLNIIPMENLPVEFAPIKEIPKIFLALQKTDYITDHLNSKMEYLSDVLTITFYFLNSEDVKSIILTGQDSGQEGLNLCHTLIPVFAEFLIKNTVLEELNSDMCQNVFNHMLAYYGKQKNKDHINTLLIDKFLKIWPKIEDQPFTNIHTILTNILKIESIHIPMSSAPGRWWLHQMSVAEVEVKVKLMRVLPVFTRRGVCEDVNEEFDLALQSYVAICGTNPSEAAAPRRALLAVTPAVKSDAMLRALVAVVYGEEMPDWLETAISTCMSQIAVKQDHRILTSCQSYCDKYELSIKLYERVLMPLIRHSRISTCEKYFASSMQQVLVTLNKKLTATSDVGKSMYFVKCGRALNIAQAAFEKLPPSSPAFSQLKLTHGKNLAQELCKLCVTVRKETKGNNAQVYRYFQCSAYSCLTTVLLSVGADASKFKVVFQDDLWPKIIDCEKEFVFYIQGLGLRPRVRQPVSSVMLSHSASLSLSPSHTMTSRVRNTMLSDNPFQYDLTCGEENEVESGGMPAGAVTRPAYMLPVLSYLKGRGINVAQYLTSPLLNGERNVRWFIAQAIIACKDELKSEASDLTAGLLAVVAETPYEHAGKLLLNGLHIDILNAITCWFETQPIPELPSSSSHINSTLELLIKTGVHQKRDKRNSVFKAVLKTLSDFSKLFFEYINLEWKIFEEILKDSSNEIACHDILVTLSKNKIYIPGLVTDILSKLTVKQTVSARLSHLSQLFGLSMTACQDGAVKTSALSNFVKILDRLRKDQHQDYLKVLYNAQKEYPPCCNEFNFRQVTDLTNKTVQEMKSKCLEILSTYISTQNATNEYVTYMYEVTNICEVVTSDLSVQGMKIVKSGLRLMDTALRRRVIFLVATFCESPHVGVRRTSIEVMVEEFREIFGQKTDHQPKRPKLEYPSVILKLLNEKDVYKNTILSKIGKSLADKDEIVRDTAFKCLVDKLSTTEMDIRFCECVLICLYLSSITSSNSDKSEASDPSAPLAAILKLFFYGITSQKGFEKLLLKDEPLAVTNNTSFLPSKLLTMSRVYQGTFRSMFTAGTVRKGAKKPLESNNHLIVQIPIQEIIDTLLHFAEATPDAASIIFKEILKLMIVNQLGFNLSVCLADILARTVAKQQVNSLTPTVVEACRVVVVECSRVDGFNHNVSKLLETVKGTEGEILVQLLYEEVKICNSDIKTFQMGFSTPDEDTNMYEESTEFSLKDLISAFGKLSNWDDLTIQERKMAGTHVPVFWTDTDEFDAAVNQYPDTELPHWMSVMRQSLARESNLRLHYVWLKQLQKWPRRHFQVAAVTEAIEWNSLKSVEDLQRLSCVVRPSDCMAEWAVRLMLRTIHITSILDKTDLDVWNKRAREHALVWCEEANRREMPELTLNYIRKVMGDLEEAEVLPWLHQQALSLRNLAFNRTELKSELLGKALHKLESYTKEDYISNSPLDVVTRVYNLKLQLQSDLNTLTDDIVNQSVRSTDQYVMDDIDCKSLANISNIYKMAMCYFDGLWKEGIDAEEQDEILSNMADCLNRMLRINLPEIELFVCMILNRISQYSGEMLPEPIAEKLVEMLKPLKHLHATSRNLLTKIQPLFGTHIITNVARVVNNNRVKQALQLVCDAPYVLRQYCLELTHSLDDEDEQTWSSIINRIKSLLNNPYSGPAVQLLSKYKSGLEEIYNFEPTKDFRIKSRTTLRDVINQLSNYEDKNTLNLVDVCPALTRDFSDLNDRDGDSLRRILQLGEGIKIVKFDRQIKVFTDSLRRPCILSATLSNGKSAKFLIKRGERFTVDASVAQAKHDLGFYSFTVTPIGEDSAVIEFLENHVTVRSLIERKYNLNALLQNCPPAAPRSAGAMSQFLAKCEAVPSHALRSAIEEDCATLQDFIIKKSNFQDSLAEITVAHWIFGLGDRHLNNVLFDTTTGTLRDIDLSAVCQFGATAGPEPIPARLTRMLSANVYSSVLESRIQSCLSRVRDLSHYVLPALYTRFKYITDFDIPDVDCKLNYIRDIITGRALSHTTMIDALDQASNKGVAGASLYSDYLKEIFQDVKEKEEYSVEEQVANLLRHCTDLRLLCVTRPGWEPWL